MKRDLGIYFMTSHLIWIRVIPAYVNASAAGRVTWRPGPAFTGFEVLREQPEYSSDCIGYRWVPKDPHQDSMKLTSTEACMMDL